jgi:hypothetical protein
MAADRSGFEIHAYRGNNWVLEETRETESLARQVAKAIINKPRVGGIRIIKTWRRGDGQVTENTIYEEMRAASEPIVTIVPIESAPFCTDLSDFYKLESRMTVGRLLRKYVEQVFVTPTELMHNHKALKKFQEAEGLYPAAVDRVATVQARGGAVDSKTRRDELFRYVTQATDRARRAEEKGGLPELKGADFLSVYKRVKSGAREADEAAYNALVVLSRDLVGYRDWLAKLARIAELINPDGDEEVLALFDKVMADLVGIPAAFQDMLGQYPNLGQALLAIIDLYDTGRAAGRSDAEEQLAKIGPLIASGKLRETRVALIERLCRQLGSSQPLSKNDPAKERDVVKEVVARLFRADGILGGPDGAAAMTRRYVYLQEGGGLTALKNSVGQVCGSVKEMLDRILYLIELTRSELGKDLAEAIAGQLRGMIEVRDLSALVPDAKDATAKMLGAKKLFETFKADTALPPEERQRLLARIDTLLAEFIQREGIIEKLDNPAASLRDRAMRLVEFCGSGVLPDGRALSTARERVVTHLRQPNFDRIFIEGITEPAKCAELLRDFHSRLVRAGFR